MPRQPRVHVKDGLYHVFNRTAHTLAPLTQPREASLLLQLLFDTSRRDGVTIYAWCILPTSYHLALSISDCPLSRFMRTVQHSLAVSYNRNNQTLGPFWQGRYKAMLLPDREMLGQLVAYIHLQPVVQGHAGNPDEYKLSGHREIKGQRGARLVAVNKLLPELGATPRKARYRYTKLLSQLSDLEWVKQAPGRIPWWRLGRPPSGKKPVNQLTLERLDRHRRNLSDLVRAACQHLEIPRELVCSRLKSRELVQARELLAFTLLEHFDVKVTDLAAEVNKVPESVSRWYSTALRRCIEDAEFRTQGKALAQQLVTSCSERKQE